MEKERKTRWLLEEPNKGFFEDNFLKEMESTVM